MTFKNNGVPLLCYFKICASFCSHWWIKTGVTVKKRPILGQIQRFLEPYDLQIWQMTLKNNRAPLICYLKHFALFRSHCWVQSGIIVRKCPIWVKIDDFVSLVTLKFDVWHWKNNRTHLLCHLKLCASFRSRWLIQTGIKVRTRLIWVKFNDF